MTTTTSQETTVTTAVTDRTQRIEKLRAAAYRIRLNALNMGEVQGQGYIGQALGVADVLAVAYTDQLNHRPDDPHWDGRDRFLLSIGHYAIALYAALAEAGIIPVEELETYGSDESRLPMSGMASYTPGMEISGGSLGHGLTVATGMALGLRHLGNPARVYNLLSDGELDEGSTWEAAMQIAHHGLDNVTAIVDVNALQADGPTEGILRTEPVTDKWRAFGWHAIRVDGNDIEALVDAFDELRAHKGSPSVIICDTRIGRGVPLLETREKAHFMRVAAEEWQTARDQLAEGFNATGFSAAGHRHRGIRPMTTTSAAPQKKRLTTSAMIASFADPGQKTASAPFGHALASWPRSDRRSSGSRRTWPSTPTCTSSATPTRSGSSRWAWPSRPCSAPQPASPRSGSCPSRPPTRCSRPAAPTTSSASTSPSPTSTSTSSARCPA